MEDFMKLAATAVKGNFIDREGERFYCIENVDQMPPFFMSIVSANDHWLFASSTGCLSAGRGNPENALFPYRSVEVIHENAENTGPKTYIRLEDDWGDLATWEPFNLQHDGKFVVTRNLYKNITGDKVLFEERNHSLNLVFSYTWQSGNRFGFVRHSRLTDMSGEPRQVEILDGIQNILPYGAPLQAIQTRSALVDAYKWNERVEGTTLALYTMYAKLSDRADPAESLFANTVFSLDSDPVDILLSSQQIPAFRRGAGLEGEDLTRGVRGAYLIHKTITLSANETNDWMMVLDTGKDIADVVALRRSLTALSALKAEVEADCANNHDELVALIGAADGWQFSQDEATSAHHYANVLFNCLRGGVFEKGYQLRKQDVVATMALMNRQVASRNGVFFASLPETFSDEELIRRAEQSDDVQLLRLCYEYLPLTFGRRHGDPSRPWNHYDIKVKDKNGNPLLTYQGNWRDIFQNWEALALSYPKYLRSFIAKFVNASTIDGYNPYRITKEGIDWEVLEPEDPWSNIGYWGDHQIIYLLKFLEWSERFEPGQLQVNLLREIYSYANVPYRIGDTETIFATPKDTVTFDDALHLKIEKLAETMGSDARLVLDADREVYLVNLTEKLLVPLLSKLSNWVVDGGIWLNTQRPEWNDANNAIVGNGLSMVTLYYLHRYVTFLQPLFAQLPEKVRLSEEVAQWLSTTNQILGKALQDVKKKSISRQTKRKLLTELVEAANDYRQQVYAQGGFSGKVLADKQELETLLNTSAMLLKSSSRNNVREDGLFNAYNVVQYSAEAAESLPLYPMLEGQVAALSSGAISADEAVSLLDALFNSDIYRADQRSFMLYPDRELPFFTQRNVIDAEAVRHSVFLTDMLKRGDLRVLLRDADGVYHFNAVFENAGMLKDALVALRPDYPQLTDEDIERVLSLYEAVFNHREFTGRSGTMFGYEGLGCIYWHMVAKLLLAVQESYFASWKDAPDSSATQALADYYYKVREGIGFNKTPTEYGAFPVDPYSHTPKHAGAQQPGMTGQVKEEIITRFGELGLMVENGTIRIAPTLLSEKEFARQPSEFMYVAEGGVREIMPLNAGELAFTYCQVPFVYRVSDADAVTMVVTLSSGEVLAVEGDRLPSSVSGALFAHSGEVKKVDVKVPRKLLYKG